MGTINRSKWPWFKGAKGNLHLNMIYIQSTVNVPNHGRYDDRYLRYLYFWCLNDICLFIFLLV